jgi:DNA-binding NarL/FixJ family response regulator
MGAAPLLADIEPLARRGRIDPDAGDARRSRSGHPRREPPHAFGLTRQEREVLALVASGLTNREIGQDLFISEGTASVHVSNILGKVGVTRRTQAAALAHELRFVEPSSRRACRRR